MRHRITKYLLFCFTLPALAFAGSFLLSPLTHSVAHDGGAIGMSLGVMIAQVLLGRWVSDTRWFISVPLALLISWVMIVTGFALVNRLYVVNGMTNAPEAFSLFVQVIFLVACVLMSIMIWEVVFRISAAVKGTSSARD